jgi:hypothetical protein
MSTPGDLSWLRAALFHSLDCGELELPAESPEIPWLDWLGIPWKPAPQASSLEVHPLGVDFTAQELRDRGLLGEVVYGALVQTLWHPQQQSWVARTRSEIAACYSSADLDSCHWPLTLEVLDELNAYRLQELTPGELLEHSRPFWKGCPDPCDEAVMEGWVLLHFSTFERLQDVADCLHPFCETLPRNLWKIPPGMNWSEVEAMLGPERLHRLLGVRP